MQCTLFEIVNILPYLLFIVERLILEYCKDILFLDTWANRIVKSSDEMSQIKYVISFFSG